MAGAMVSDRHIHPFDELVERLQKDLFSRLVAAGAMAGIGGVVLGPSLALYWLCAIVLNELIELMLGRMRAEAQEGASPGASQGPDRGRRLLIALFCANLFFGGAVWAVGALGIAAAGSVGPVIVGLAILVGGLTHVVATSIFYLPAFISAAIPMVLALAGMPLVLSATGEFSAADLRLGTVGVAFLLIYTASAAGQSYARERKLAHYLGQVSIASEAKSRFLATMSHEIRTPLNGVIGLTEVLQKSPLDGPQREIVSLIQSSGQTLERLVSDVLDASKIEAGRLDLNPGVFDLREAIETAACLMRSRADDKGLGFAITLDPAADGRFIGDAVRIRQIVSNLISNAVKFTDAGEVALRVDARQSGGSGVDVQITVTDTGIGFDAETARRLFGRFEQADSSISRKFGGTGLGLSICKSLVEMMGGEIAASSVPGQGSTFTVRLRLPRAPEQALPSAEPVRDSAAPADGPPLRILVAEDNPVNQRVICMMLESFGAEVTLAEHGGEAVDHFRARAFDLVLMDMMMPQLDGLAATRAIRLIEAERGARRTPVAMLSANAMAEHVQAAEEAGCDAHIAKPVSGATLIAGIEEALQRAETTARMQREAQPPGARAWH